MLVYAQYSLPGLVRMQEDQKHYWHCIDQSIQRHISSIRRSEFLGMRLYNFLFAQL